MSIARRASPAGAAMRAADTRRNFDFERERERERRRDHGVICRGYCFFPQRFGWLLRQHWHV
jgi:hypothetical protein